jgi:hypothetical protein
VVCTTDLHAGPTETEWAFRGVLFITHNTAFPNTDRACLWVSRPAITVDPLRVNGMPTNERAPVCRIAAVEIVAEIIIKWIAVSAVDTGMIQGRTLVPVWDCLSTDRDKSFPA